MYLNYIFILFSFGLGVVVLSGKVKYYLITERAHVTYVNRSYVLGVNITARRLGRKNPMYYVDLHYNSAVEFNNSYKLDFYVYEFLSNEYRRGFVEMHYSFCDFIHKDPLFGAAMKQGKLSQPCPYPSGEYNMYNMSIPSANIPPGFPFTKGRIYCNMTHHRDTVVRGYIDMELRQMRLKPDRG